MGEEIKQAGAKADEKLFQDQDNCLFILSIILLKTWNLLVFDTGLYDK